METAPIACVLVSDEPELERGLRNLLEDGLREASLARIHLGENWDQELGGQPLDILFLAPSDDAQAEQWVRTIREKREDTPVLVLGTDWTKEEVSQLVRCGAADVLDTAILSPELLERAVRYVLERTRMQQALRMMSLTDGLTGLSNRRGFVVLADQHFKVDFRRRLGMLLLVIDVIGLETINQEYGTNEGDRALIQVAGLLRGSFRESDLVARVGDDEFAVLAIDFTADPPEILIQRLQARLASHNAHRDAKFPIRLAMSVSRHEGSRLLSAEELLTERLANLREGRGVRAE